jgi:hypothetical protein
MSGAAVSAGPCPRVVDVTLRLCLHWFRFDELQAVGGTAATHRVIHRVVRVGRKEVMTLTNIYRRPYDNFEKGTLGPCVHGLAL